MIPIHGLYSAVVVSNSDPEQRGRVQLQIPQITGLAVSGWAEPITAGESVPGDHVYMTFEGGDRNYPLFWPKVRRPGGDPARAVSVSDNDAGYVVGANIWGFGLTTGKPQFQALFTAPLSGQVIVSYSAVSFIQDLVGNPLTDAYAYLGVRVLDDSNTYVTESKESNSGFAGGAARSMIYSTIRVSNLPPGQTITARMAYLVDTANRRAWFDSMRLTVIPVIPENQ